MRKIIDFHTHPFASDAYNFCRNIEYCHMSIENTERHLRSIGVVHIMGSVIKGRTPTPDMAHIKALNDEALRLREFYRGFYIPGIHVHPAFVRESIEEVLRMKKEGVTLVGELVPYIHGWKGYSSDALHEILDCVEECGMVVSFHGSTDYSEESVRDTDLMVERHPKITFVGAHVCDGQVLLSHIDRLKRYPNYMVDLSGGGIYRHGVLRRLIDECGYDRILFGSDYPVCNPAAYVGGVEFDFLINEEEKNAIFYENAARLFKIEG